MDIGATTAVDTGVSAGIRQSVRQERRPTAPAAGVGLQEVGKSRQIGAQFLDALPSDGERRLMLAVLIDAIRTLSLHEPAATRVRAHRAWLRDRAWLLSNDHAQPFSFISICNALGFNHDYIRRSVLRLPDADRPVRLYRYAAKVQETWNRQQRLYTRASPSAARSRLYGLGQRPVTFAG